MSWHLWCYTEHVPNNREPVHQPQTTCHLSHVINKIYYVILVCHVFFCIFLSFLWFIIFSSSICSSSVYSLYRIYFLNFLYSLHIVHFLVQGIVWNIKKKLSSVISLCFLLYANMHYLFLIIMFCCGIFCTFFNSFFLCALHQKKIYICMHSIVCIASFCVLIFCLCIFCLSSQYFLHILFYFTSFFSILSAISFFQAWIY